MRPQLLLRGQWSDRPFDATLRDLLDETGFSLRELGARSGFSSGYLSLLASGDRPGTLAAMKKIADGLGLDPLLFLEVRLEAVTEYYRARPEELDRRLRSIYRHGTV